MAAAAGDLPPAALALQLAPAEAAEAERRETRAALAEATAAALMSSPTHRTMVAEEQQPRPIPGEEWKAERERERSARREEADALRDEIEW